MIEKLMKFIDKSPTSFQAVDEIKKELLTNGYIELLENSNIQIEKDMGYFITRNQTSIIAFKAGKRLNKPSFNIVASHSDCPSYKIKPNADIKASGYHKLNVEGYGGMIRTSWLDWPLSIAGRVLVKSENKVKSELVNIEEDLMVIPSVAIHLTRNNENKPLNQQTDLLPLVSVKEEFSLKSLLANKLNYDANDIISYDLYLYPRIKGFKFDELFASYHIDNLECAYTSLQAFMNSENDDSVAVYACFDNEEVGSRTRQGAASTFLDDVLSQIAISLEFDYNSALASSLMVSADNAHAIHPNHPELADQNNHVKMNEGIVIKYNANQSYTSDALSSALFIQCLNKAKVPYQYYTNRSDMAGGGTLGYVSSSVVSVISVDIGLAQLAMHSTLEVAGQKDIDYMIDGLKAFYASHIIKNNENDYIVE